MVAITSLCCNKYVSLYIIVTCVAKKIVHIATKKNESLQSLRLYCNHVSSCHIAVYIMAREVCISTHVFTWAFVISALALDPSQGSANHYNKGKCANKTPYIVLHFSLFESTILRAMPIRNFEELHGRVDP